MGGPINETLINAAEQGGGPINKVVFSKAIIMVILQQLMLSHL